MSTWVLIERHFIIWQGENVGFQLRTVRLLTLLHNWKSSVPVLHFKLKLKDLQIYLYCLAPAQCVSFLRLQMLRNRSLEVRIHKTLPQWKLSVHSAVHLPKEFISYQRADNCWNRCNCRSVDAPLWSPNQPPHVWLHLISLSDNLGVISWQKRSRSQGALESEVERDKDRAWEKTGEEMDFFSNYARNRDFVKIKLGDTRAHWGTRSL